MTEEEQFYIPKVVELMKKVAIKRGGELVTPEDVSGYVWYPSTDIKTYMFKVKYSLMKMYEGSRYFYFSNNEFDKEKHFNRKEIKGWRKSKFLKRSNPNGTLLKYDDIKIEYDIVIKSDNGNIVALEPSLADYVDSKTFDTFKELYV
jgi:hypothetical protein